MCTPRKTSKFKHRCWISLVCLTVLSVAAACSSDDGDDTAKKAASDAGSMVDAASKPCVNLPSGDYFLGIRLIIAGVRVPFNMKIESEGCMSQGGTLTKVELFGTGYSVANKGWLSPRIALAEQVAVKPDNSFVLDFGDLTVPAKTSPTGGATKSAMVLHVFS